MPRRVLVVDDDASARCGLERMLTLEGYAVDVAGDGQGALGVAEQRNPDLVITDLKMPRMSGNELLRELKCRQHGLPVIVMTGHGDVSTAVDAMKAGAVDFLVKPIDYEALSTIVANAFEQRGASGVTRQPSSPGDGADRRQASPLEGFLGVSQPMQRIYRLARRVARSRAAVLITGESGTGKGALARAIHLASPRATGPFVSVQPTALVDTLLESELFGHERGAFTGADRRRIGRFEQADGGTLFLDEIGDVPQATQVKLLRVLQERSFERVGGNDCIRTDVRFIAATNRDLPEAVRNGRFREDLYYRINVVHIEMPPLRVRGEDVATLAAAFLSRCAEENGKEIHGFSGRALERIREHSWPGNVRELQNAVERAVVLCEGPLVEEEHLPLPTESVVANGRRRSLADIERAAIVSTLEAVDWSTTRAAEILGISVRTIQYRLHEYGLASRRRRASL